MIHAFTVASPRCRRMPGLCHARGHCRPFGATPEPNGVNFAVFSRHAERVHLVLFQDGLSEPIAEIPLDPTVNKTGDVWHIFVADLPPDTLYGYRVFGPVAPQEGHYFDPRHVVIDPYARAVSGGHRWGVAGPQRREPAHAPGPPGDGRLRLARRPAPLHADAGHGDL